MLAGMRGLSGAPPRASYQVNGGLAAEIGLGAALIAGEFALSAAQDYVW